MKVLKIGFLVCLVIVQEVTRQKLEEFKIKWRPCMSVKYKECGWSKFHGSSWWLTKTISLPLAKLTISLYAFIASWNLLVYVWVSHFPHPLVSVWNFIQLISHTVAWYDTRHLPLCLLLLSVSLAVKVIVSTTVRGFKVKGEHLAEVSLSAKSDHWKLRSQWGSRMHCGREHVNPSE